MSKWKTIAGHLAGFGEVVLEVDHEDWQGGDDHLRARRLTVLQLEATPKGPVPMLGKWFPQIEYAHEVFSVKRSSFTVLIEPTKLLRNRFVELWSQIKTVDESALRRLPGRNGP